MAITTQIDYSLTNSAFCKISFRLNIFNIVKTSSHTETHINSNITTTKCRNLEIYLTIEQNKLELSSAKLSS